ncbi:MAG: hemolysin family protein [Candidatus Cyclobacteriaceae bacterium M3_2C_046]
MTLLIVYLLIALSISFLCSLLEAVLLSTSTAYIETLYLQGKSVGKSFKKLKQDVDKPLSAILTLNTIAHTIGAAGVGAQATKLYGDAYIGIVSAIMTLLILVLSEIIPKSLGAVYWKSFSKFTVKTLNFLILILYPFVILSLGLTKIIRRNQKQTTTSREEIAAMASLGTEEGVFEEGESRIINNLIKLKQIKVEDIMTPRTVIYSFPEDLTIDEVFEEKNKLRFSRIPVYQENIDQINGYILKFDLLQCKLDNRTKSKLRDIKREIMIFYEKKSVADLLESMVEKGEHIALVIDEYGGVSGLVTLEDVLETVLGLEIVDESDANINMQQLARDKWKQRAIKLGLIQSIDSDIKPDSK